MVGPISLSQVSIVDHKLPQHWASQVAQWQRIHLLKQETQDKEVQFNPWVGKILEAENGTPVFLPGKAHGQRNLVGYRPWGCKRVGQD